MEGTQIHIDGQSYTVEGAPFTLEGAQQIQIAEGGQILTADGQVVSQVKSKSKLTGFNMFIIFYLV